MLKLMKKKSLLSITNIIIVIISLIFVYTWIVRIPLDSMAAYGLNSETYEGIGIFTSMFLHAGLIHLAFNMYALYDLGNDIERRISGLKYVGILFLSGLGGSLMSIPFVMNSNVNVVGFSGAIFGLWAYMSVKDNNLKQFGILWLVMNVGLVLLGMPLAWYAHAGGTVVGLLWGLKDTINRYKGSLRY